MPYSDYYICIHTHIYTFVYICIYIYIYIFLYISKYKWAYIIKSYNASIKRWLDTKQGVLSGKLKFWGDLIMLQGLLTRVKISIMFDSGCAKWLCELHFLIGRLKMASNSDSLPLQRQKCNINIAILLILAV